MELDRFVYKNHKKLRFGYTTGSCAAAAAGAAACLLLSGSAPQWYELELPAGITLRLPVEYAVRRGGAASCAICKSAGDDPDVTDGLYIHALVQKTEDGISIDGGEGVGRVTREGLDQKPGEAAINTTPRRMITRELCAACQKHGYTGGLSAVISVPGGITVAARTFNPRLGIEGGISILGTSGLVEPMSEQALIDTIRTEMKQHAAAGEKYLLLTPGNYGESFLRDTLGIAPERAVKCSNFIGDALDFAMDFHFEGVLLVGHIGKLVKLAGGVMNTHSRCADARMEITAAHAGLCGASRDCMGRLMECVTMDAAIPVLTEADLLAPVVQSLLRKISFHMNARVRGEIPAGAVLFSSSFGELGRTAQADDLLASIMKGET